MPQRSISAEVIQLSSNSTSSDSSGGRGGSIITLPTLGGVSLLASFKDHNFSLRLSDLSGIKG